MNGPLQLRFKILALAPQITVADADGRTVMYVKQKMFRLRESVTVYGDETQSTPLYRIEADRILDISARYRITDAASGTELGVVQRRGIRSLWSAHYEVVFGGRNAMTIREENPWIKVIDGLMQQIPVLGMLSGYVFHPSYVVSDVVAGQAVMRATKQAAFLEGRYRVETLGQLDDAPERVAVLSILMMLLLERARG